MYNISIYKKVDNFNNLNKKIVSLNVLQDFMDTISEDTPATEKLKKVNEILIQKYDIKYSTIVIYDGAEYKIVASNVEQQHWQMLSDLYADPIFADSIQTATPKYITVDKETERLPYQKNEFGRAKSAMFFPLYIDNVYIGYWIIEGSKPHEFDKVDTTILEVVRNNIVTMLKTVQNQSTIENIVRDDLYSGLKSAEYLYGEGKKIIDQHMTSAICIFKVVNLPDINNDISRKTGDMLVTKISEFMKNNLGKDYIFVRYMGPKFAIVFSGANPNGVQSFMEDMKKQMEAISVPAQEDYYDKLSAGGTPRSSLPEITVSPTIRIGIANYYKGTQLDGAFKKLEQFIDSNNAANITVL
jgi:GGDEF domain-containing protein